MTSKEALSDLLNVADYCLEEEERKQIKKEYKIILKDLEILEILKRVFNYKSIQKFIEDMSVEEWFKIKEWLENGK